MSADHSEQKVRGSGPAHDPAQAHDDVADCPACTLLPLDPTSPNAQQGAPRAVPHGLEAYPSLLKAFAADQPRHRYGLQNHGSVVEPRVVVKTPNNSRPYDTPLPKYQHDTDNALAVDVAVLWRALSRDKVPDHESYTLEKCKFNHDAPYLTDAALLRKLGELDNFLDLKAFLEKVLEPPKRPPKPRSGHTSQKRKWYGDWPDRKRLYKGKGNLFEKLLTPDNLEGTGTGKRLSLPTAAMKAEPFEWEPADPASKAPPTMLLTCPELGVENVNATLGQRTSDGYRMGKGTQELLTKLKAKPGDVLQLRVTKKEGDTIHVDVQLKRRQAATATATGSGAGGTAAGGSIGGAPSFNHTAAGGSIGGNPSISRAAAVAATGAAVVADPAESASPSREESLSDFGPSSDEGEDDDVQIDGESKRLTSAGETHFPGYPLVWPSATGPQYSREALAFADGASVAAGAVAQQQMLQQAEGQQQIKAEEQHAQPQMLEQVAGQQQALEQAQGQQQVKAEEQQAQQRQQQQQQQQQSRTSNGGATGGGAHATGGDSGSATAKLAEALLDQRLTDAVQALGQAASSDQRLRPLLSLAAVGLGGVLMQEIVRRWGRLSEDSCELIADAVASIGLHNDSQQQLLPQLRLALEDAGERWHSSIADIVDGESKVTEDPPAAVVAKWRRRAAHACEDVAAALASNPAKVTSESWMRPLRPLAMGFIGGAPLKEAVAGWAGYTPVQQRRLFEDVLVAVHQGAWQQLEARMQATLQLLPSLPEDDGKSSAQATLQLLPSLPKDA